MTVVTVWAFPERDAVQRAELILGTLSARGELSVVDGAVITWPPSRDTPQPRPLHSVAVTEAIGSAFWGMLVGAVFFAPALGALGPVDSDSLSAMLAGIGLDGGFVQRVRRVVVRGTSALIVLTPTDPEPADSAFAGFAPARVSATLSDGEQRALHAVFAG